MKIKTIILIIVLFFVGFVGCGENNTTSDVNLNTTDAAIMQNLQTRICVNSDYTHLYVCVYGINQIGNNTPISFYVETNAHTEVSNPRKLYILALTINGGCENTYFRIGSLDPELRNSIYTASHQNDAIISTGYYHILNSNMDVCIPYFRSINEFYNQSEFISGFRTLVAIELYSVQYGIKRQELYLGFKL